MIRAAAWRAATGCALALACIPAAAGDPLHGQYLHPTHRILTDMWYPWLVGFRRPPMLGNHFWKYLDIDPSLRR